MRRHDTSASSGRRPISVLDIGTSKVSCIIAEADMSAAGGKRAVGFGYHQARGIKAGVVADLEEAEASVRAAVGQAERAAGVRIERVHLGVACGRLKSQIFKGQIPIQSGGVAERDIASLYRGAREFVERDGRSLVMLNRLDFRLDDAGGIRDPRGMAAKMLGADMHAVTADAAPLRNLLVLLERCELTAESLVPTALASALAVASPDERRIGVTCLDIGGGVTTIAMFADGHFVHTDVIPVGGKHLTFDISRELVTPLAEAERIKTLYATLAVAASDEHEPIAYPGADETEPTRHETSKARLSVLARQRVGDLLALVRERMAQADAAAVAGEHVVVTGGASQALGLAEFAANILGRPVRVARPTGLAGLPGAGANPSLSAAVGLVAAAGAPEYRVEVRPETAVLGRSYLGRVERWLRESF
jgi:cell division protein FtsA